MMKPFFLILLCLCSLSACTPNDKWIKITDFSKKQKFPLKVEKNRVYATYVLKLRGKVNDTILIEKRIKLTGTIDTVFILDYYGGKKDMIFDPYKATSGNLEFSHAAN